MRLQQVSIDRLSNVPKLLSFYMGKNTPDRKSFIMDHLV
jgi:topoisomerase-4 subunit B